MRNAPKILIGKHEGKTPIGITGHRWKDKIKMALRNMVWQCVLGSSGSEKSPVASSCEHGNESLGSIKSSEFFD
jgi:hypothetical protein